MSGQHVTVSAGINRLYRYQNQGEHDVKSYLLSALTANLLAVAISAAVTIPAGAADTPAAAVAAVTTAPRASGIGTAYMDPTVRPQDDFFLNLNGKWLRDTQIPADRSSWGAISSRSCAASSRRPPRMAGPRPTPGASAISTPASWTRPRSSSWVWRR